MANSTSLKIMPRSTLSDDLGLVKADYGFSQGIVVRVSYTAHTRLHSCFAQRMERYPRPMVARGESILSYPPGHIEPVLRRQARGPSLKTSRIRQPTMNRAKVSMTNAAYTNPLRTATYVRSATHNWLGRSAVKFFPTKSGRSIGRFIRDRSPYLPATNDTF